MTIGCTAVQLSPFFEMFSVFLWRCSIFAAVCTLFNLDRNSKSISDLHLSQRNLLLNRYVHPVYHAVEAGNRYWRLEEVGRLKAC